MTAACRIVNCFLGVRTLPLFVPSGAFRDIEANRVWSVLFVIGIILLIILMVGWLYALHYYTLEGCSFYQAHRKSKTRWKPAGFVR